MGGKRAVYSLHCVTFLINITAHPKSPTLGRSSNLLNHSFFDLPNNDIDLVGVRGFLPFVVLQDVFVVDSASHMLRLGR